MESATETKSSAPTSGEQTSGASTSGASASGAPASSGMNRPPALVVVQTIWESFLLKRGLSPIERKGSAPARAPSSDQIVSDLELFGYMRITALRGEQRVVILVMAAEGKYTRTSGDLRSFLVGVANEKHEKPLGELIVITSPDFLKRKHMMEVVRTLGQKIKNASLLINVYSYEPFVMDVTKHCSSQGCAIMSPKEFAKKMPGLSANILPQISARDPQVIWLGGVPGQIVHVLRDSETAGVASYPRLIV